MIVVCSLQAAPEQVQIHAPSKIISILSPPTVFPTFGTHTSDSHLKLTFHDVAHSTPGLQAPGEHDMARLLSFLESWDQRQPLLIHCWAGISRSSAAAYIAQCMFNPDKDESHLAGQLRLASASATPNPMLVRLADGALGREGRMVSAIEQIGRGADAYAGLPYIL